MANCIDSLNSHLAEEDESTREEQFRFFIPSCAFLPVLLFLWPFFMEHARYFEVKKTKHTEQ